MKVKVWPWACGYLPDDLQKGQEIEVTGEDILRWFERGYTVALMHSRPPDQTRKEIQRDGQKPEGTPILAFEERYQRFQQR